MEGDAPRFTVAATGAAPPTNERIHNGTVLSETTSTLALPSATFADRGWYRVKVSNAEGATTSVPRLDVGLAESFYCGWGNAPAYSGSTPLKAISASATNRFVLGLDHAGAGLGRGYDYDGKLTVPADLTEVVQEVSGRRSVAIKADGTVREWDGLEAPWPPVLGPIVALVGAAPPRTLESAASRTTTARTGRYRSDPARADGFSPDP